MTEPVIESPGQPAEPDVEIKTTEAESDVDGIKQVAVETDFYNAQAGAFGRLPGTYLDEVEAEQAEIVRAAQQDREPDLENPPATAGQPLVVPAQLAPTSLTSVSHSVDPELAPISAPVSTTLPSYTDPVAIAEQQSNEAAANSVPEDSVDTTHADQTAAEDAARNDGITTPTNSSVTTDQSTPVDWNAQAPEAIADAPPPTTPQQLASIDPPIPAEVTTDQSTESDWTALAADNPTLAAPLVTVEPVPTEVTNPETAGS